VEGNQSLEGWQTQGVMRLWQADSSTSGIFSDRTNDEQILYIIGM